MFIAYYFKKPQSPPEIENNEYMYCLGGHLLEHTMQVCRESWVCELGRTIVVVNKVDAACGRVSDLPAWRQWAQLLAVNVA